MKEEKDIFKYLNKKENSVPDACYFENMADNIIFNESKETPIVPLFKKPPFWMISTAASLAIFFLINQLAPNDNNVLLALNDISTTEIEGYISQNITDFDSDLISEFVSEDNIEESALEPQKEIDLINLTNSNLQLDDIDSDEILDYFDNEEIDIYEDDLELDYDELYF